MLAMKKLKNLAKNNRQHGNVDMLKAARSTVAEPVSCNLLNDIRYYNARSKTASVRAAKTNNAI